MGSAQADGRQLNWGHALPNSLCFYQKLTFAHLENTEVIFIPDMTKQCMIITGSSHQRRRYLHAEPALKRLRQPGSRTEEG